MKKLTENTLDGKKDVNGLRNKRKGKLVIMRKEIRTYNLNCKKLKMNQLKRKAWII